MAARKRRRGGCLGALLMGLAFLIGLVVAVAFLIAALVLQVEKDNSGTFGPPPPAVSR